MLKYLTKKNNTYWYRRRVHINKEIIFSLKTRDYDEALLRHSFVNCEINYLFSRGIKNMTDIEINNIIDKYKVYMIEKTVNKYSRQRDKELATYLNGDYFGGHTREALQVAINKYSTIHNNDDYDLVKAITTTILKRSNIEDEFNNLSNDDDIYSFHFKLFKTEWDLLYKAKVFQDKLPNNKESSLTTNGINNISESNSDKNTYRTSELLKMYIEEKAIANKWSNKNIRDIKYVIGHLISWYDDSYANIFKRLDFSNFRNDVIQKLPQKTTNMMYKDKSTAEIIEIAKNKKKGRLGITAINKHIGRVNQLFQWAEDTGYIKKNYASNLRIKDTRITKNKRTLKDTYEEEDLIKLFNNSPWYTTELSDTLINYPHNIFIPLLSIFNGGAKATELAQLYVSDIKKIKGIWVIDFNDEEDKVLKDAYYNTRKVPIAQKIIDIGFLDYVKYQRKEKSKRLFPTVSLFESGGSSFTNAFSKYNREYITNDEKKTFYSIKHLVNQEFKNKKVEVYIINDITGHSHGSDNKDISTYGASQMPENIMKESIDECLTFDYIDLSHIKNIIKDIY